MILRKQFMSQISSDIVSVMVSVAVDGPYSYRVPDGMQVQRGSVVQVPLGPRKVMGVVWGEPKDQVAHNRLKDIDLVFDTPPLTDELMKLVDWIAKYTLAQPGMVLRGVLRSPEAFGEDKPIAVFRYSGQLPERMTSARQRVIDVMEDGFAWQKRALVGETGVSPSVIEGLVKMGTLEQSFVPPPPIVQAPDFDFAPLALNDEQQAALELLREHDPNEFGVSLLDGVTGSGKTEVFFEAVADCLRAGRQAVILLPEIALTHTFLKRFEARFGAKPGGWHSDMTPVQRARMWRSVARGKVQVVVGARSALFLPYPDLGLIVIDEEHDGAFKQADRVNYHARDMAVVRAHLANARVILSSATPSVESRNNADQGRYQHVKMLGRFADAKMPDITAIDMKEEGPEKGEWIAPRLAREIFGALDKKEQVLLFLNRRGYAPLTLCRDCGYQYQCPDCSTWLVEHRFRGVLSCHHCGHEVQKPKTCKECGAQDSLIPIGPGIERIAEEAARRFPDAKRVILSSDMGGIAAARERFEEIARGDYDLIIGTQLVAKGHHFPKLNLVGVLDADLGLAHGDPRAAEKTFQILTQVTGRAGRTGTAGRAFMQTYVPEHAVMQAMVRGDREAFYKHELKARESAGLPPFGRLAALIVSATEHDAAFGHARGLAVMAPKAPDSAKLKLFGPADAPVAMVRGRHRVRLLVQADKHFDLSGYVRFWLNEGPKCTGNLRVQVDIDPMSFY